MKKSFPLFLLLLSASFCFSQSGPEKKLTPCGKRNLIAAGITIPLGDFSNTHFGGFNTVYAWSKNRFGRLTTLPAKKIGFTANSGIAYYFGKKETIGTGSYQYPAYIFLHIYAGAMYNADEKVNICLTAGPAAGIYNSNTQFNAGVSLQCNYYVSDKIAITPGLIMMKETRSDPIWSGSVRAAMVF
ncbi:MAG: hypothetical protein JNK27_17935 [Chitinophagaceae bacterium]|nr:hypothetical protein [Chitinophagaceae bacterium]